MRFLYFLLGFLCLFGFVSIMEAQAPAPVTYEVYAIRYATFPNFPVASLVAGADKDRKTDIAMTIWLLKGSNGRNVLVDTGCYHDNLVKGNGLIDHIKPSDALAKLNLQAEQITDVIIT